MLIELPEFEGPLDLLLYLIRRHNLDVLDIPMAALTQQYMTYIEAMQQHRLELAAEYLLMAAVLIEIKSRMLLPRPPAPPGAEAEDPRAELVRQLLEHGIDEGEMTLFDDVAVARSNNEYRGRDGHA